MPQSNLLEKIAFNLEQINTNLEKRVNPYVIEKKDLTPDYVDFFSQKGPVTIPDGAAVVVDDAQKKILKENKHPIMFRKNKFDIKEDGSLKPKVVKTKIHPRIYFGDSFDNRMDLISPNLKLKELNPAELEIFNNVLKMHEGSELQNVVKNKSLEKAIYSHADPRVIFNEHNQLSTLDLPKNDKGFRPDSRERIINQFKNMRTGLEENTFGKLIPGGYGDGPRINKRQINFLREKILSPSNKAQAELDTIKYMGNINSSMNAKKQYLMRAYMPDSDYAKSFIGKPPIHEGPLLNKISPRSILNNSFLAPPTNPLSQGVFKTPPVVPKRTLFSTVKPAVNPMKSFGKNLMSGAKSFLGKAFKRSF